MRSWSAIASSTAWSSTRLNAAASSPPASRSARAFTSAAGRRRLPTTSVRHIVTPAPALRQGIQGVPRIDDPPVRLLGVIIRSVTRELALARLVVQHADVHKGAGLPEPVADGDDRAAAVPDVVDHEDPAALDVTVVGELDERRRRERAFLAIVEHDRGAEDVADPGALADEASGHHATTRDDEDVVVVTRQDAQELADHALDVAPADVMSVQARCLLRDGRMAHFYHKSIS